MTDGPDDRGRTIYLAVLAAMVTSVLTTWGLRALEGPVGTGDDTVEVPAVVGVDAPAAAGVAEAEGLRLVVVGQEPSLEAGPDVVVRQTPLAGSRLGRGATIEVVTSSGRPEVAVPDLVGTKVAEARARLEAAGLSVGDLTREGEGPPDTVTALDPEAGTEIPAGSSVDLVAVPEGILVPDLRGMSRSEAEEAVEALGLSVERRYRYAPSKPEFSVLDQDPAPESRVDPGSEVELTLAE